MPTSPVKNLITGGAGFVGSHLVDRLMKSGEKVICLDNLFLLGVKKILNTGLDIHLLSL